MDDFIAKQIVEELRALNENLKELIEMNREKER